MSTQAHKFRQLADTLTPQTAHEPESAKPGQGDQLPLLPAEPLRPPVQLVYALNEVVYDVDEDAGDPYVLTQYGKVYLRTVDLRRDLYDSIKDVGQIIPLITLTDTKRMHVVDGLHRLRAWWELYLNDEVGLGDPVIRVEEYDAVNGWNFEAVIGLIANAMRRANPLAELRKIEALLKEYAPDGIGQLTPDEVKTAISQIAKATGLKHGTVKKRLKLLDLDDRLRAALETGQISVGAAERAAKLPQPLQGELARKLDDEDARITHADVQDVRRVRVQEAVSMFDAGAFNTPGAAEAMGDPVVSDDQVVSNIELRAVIQTAQHPQANGHVELPADVVLKAFRELLIHREATVHDNIQAPDKPSP